jgi:hypothetical protein
MVSKSLPGQQRTRNGRARAVSKVTISAITENFDVGSMREDLVTRQRSVGVIIVSTPVWFGQELDASPLGNSPTCF